MFGEKSKLYSIFSNKCPRCHEGNFFKYKISFNPKKISTIHNSCSKCNLKYMMEPSFYFGAMYINYAITVLLFVSIFIITKVILDLSIIQSFASIIAITLILSPVSLRLSRIIWINLFVSYKNKKELELLKKESS